MKMAANTQKSVALIIINIFCILFVSLDGCKRSTSNEVCGGWGRFKKIYNTQKMYVSYDKMQTHPITQIKKSRLAKLITVELFILIYII